MLFLIELVFLILIGLYGFYRLAVVLLKEPSAEFWLIDPPWNGDGRKYIIKAATEEQADHIYMRKICGWNAVLPGERSAAVITKLETNKDGIIVV